MSGPEPFNHNEPGLPSVVPEKSSPFAVAMHRLLPILAEREIAEVTPEDICIPGPRVGALYEEEYGLCRWLPPPCPYRLQIAARSVPGLDDFAFRYKYMSGLTRVLVNRVGAFIQCGELTYWLPDLLYKLMTEMDDFNALPSHEKTSFRSFLAIDTVKRLSAGLNVTLDKYFESETIIVPDTISPNIEADPKQRVTLVPNFPNVPPDLMRQSYLRVGQVQDIYDLEPTSDTRIRVLLKPPLKRALTIMRTVTKVAGRRRDAILSNPRRLFTEVEVLDVLDLSTFQRQAAKLHSYLAEPTAYIRPLHQQPALTADHEPQGTAQQESSQRVEAGIRAVDAEGMSVDLPIRDSTTLKQIDDALAQAAPNEPVAVELTDTSNQKHIVPITSELTVGITEIRKVLQEFEQSTPEYLSAEHTSKRVAPPDASHPLVPTDAISAPKDETPSCPPTYTPDALSALVFHRPTSLRTRVGKSSIELKDYQKQGIAWLQTCFEQCLNQGRLRGRTGALLADDMGLGKTLQILTFLSWCIESPLNDCLGKPDRPFNPILIVTPLMLLDTWAREIRKFFAASGQIFQPYVILHGEKLALHRKSSHGDNSETVHKALDLDRIRGNKLIITNYDTLKNYHSSFEQVHWSVLVIDEAQEIKEPQTTITWCIKQLRAQFKIASTGTPVENRLRDLWSIMDFAEPKLLGSEKEFKTKYEADIGRLSEPEILIRSTQLRETLGMGQSDAYLLRRTKEDALDALPNKYETIRLTELTDDQVRSHQEIVAAAGCQTTGGEHHFKTLQRIVKLYQHPCLDSERSVDKSPTYYWEKSPKLVDVVDLLHEIKRRREKVLIFTRYIDMQQILQLVLEHEFKLRIGIINGALTAKITPDGGGHRQELIRRFEEPDGFNVLILSPEVAGVGLTIVGANNVIHYGRWWNPAKEAQATDRVYRLGQTRDVHVYFPIAVTERFPTFDEKLHLLLSNKRALARNFLIPSESLQIRESELLAELSAASLDTALAPGGYLTLADIAELTLELFEAATGCIYRNMGYHVTMSPETQNLGISLVATNPSETLLIACRFSQNISVLHNVQELQDALGYFKAHIIPAALSGHPLKIVFVTNGSIQKALIKTLTSCASVVQEKEIKRLLAKHPITRTDVHTMNAQRVASLLDLKNQLSSVKMKSPLLY